MSGHPCDEIRTQKALLMLLDVVKADKIATKIANKIAIVKGSYGLDFNLSAYYFKLHLISA